MCSYEKYITFLKRWSITYVVPKDTSFKVGPGEFKFNVTGSGFVGELDFLFPFCHQDLQLYLSNLANQIDRETSTAEIPLVVILDDVHDAASISELVNGALTCKYHKW